MLKRVRLLTRFVAALLVLAAALLLPGGYAVAGVPVSLYQSFCLLYTSDAADDDYTV